MNYERIMRAIYSTPWAIMPEKLEAILAFMQLKIAGGGPSESVLAEIRAASAEMEARASVAAADNRGVAVLPLYGLIMHRGNMMGDVSGPRGTSTAKFAIDFRAALADPAAKAIVIDVDSPGGTVDGVPELASEILAARGQKPIKAVANSLMASAAYWAVSGVDEIIASPSALVGSIGVYTAHIDETEALAKEGLKVSLISAGKYKTEGHPSVALNADARAAMQEMVDETYGQFVKGVANGRKTTQTAVRDGYGQGRAVTATMAVKLGMADRIGTLDDVLAEMMGGKMPVKKMPMKGEQVETILLAEEPKVNIPSERELRRRQFEIFSI